MRNVRNVQNNSFIFGYYTRVISKRNERIDFIYFTEIGICNTSLGGKNSLKLELRIGCGHPSLEKSHPFLVRVFGSS